MLELLFVILLSYLIGSIPFSFIFAKIFTGIDVRKSGTGNVGATNVLVSTGKKRIGLFSVLFDMAKGVSAVYIARLFFGADIYAFTAGLFAIIGHDFSIFLRFNGGKGIATTTGAIIALNPFAIWFCLLAFIASALITRYLILSSVVTLFCLPFIMWMLGEGLYGIYFGWFSFLLAIVVHRKDIERLFSGKESKVFGA